LLPGRCMRRHKGRRRGCHCIFSFSSFGEKSRRALVPSSFLAVDVAVFVVRGTQRARAGPDVPRSFGSGGGGATIRACEEGRGFPHLLSSREYHSAGPGCVASSGRGGKRSARMPSKKGQT
jgi:hypothetical protein